MPAIPKQPQMMPGYPAQPGAGAIPVPARPAAPAGAPPPGLGMGGMGGLGAMFGLGIGAQAYRIQKGDSLEAIARLHLPPDSSPKMIQAWVQQAVALNKLSSPTAIHPGQALLVPPAFLCSENAQGAAKTSLSLFDDVDAEKVLAAQEKSTHELKSRLEAYRPAERLQHYEQMPPPSPEPADLHWLQEFTVAKMNPLLKYKPSASEEKLVTSLQHAMAWKQMMTQPTRLSKADLKQLPPQVQQQLKSWMALDGDTDSLSSLDLAKASPKAVKELILALKSNGYQPHEQRLVQVLAELSRDFSLSSFMHNEYRLGEAQAPYLAAGYKSQKLPEGDYQVLKKNLQAIEKTLSDPTLIQRGGWNLDVQGHHLVSYEPSTNTLKEFSLADSALKAEFARKHLREKFNFQPANPHDLKEIQTMVTQLKTPEQRRDFIENYMQAHYQHPGDGTRWSLATHYSEKLGMSESIFFGNPPPLDQLPDGRCLIDCEGFAKLSQLLLDKLDPQSQSLPIHVPGHVFTLAKMGDSFCVFNNDNAQTIKLSPKETERFVALFEDHNSNWDNLNPFQLSPRMSQADFPSLYEYIKTYSMPAEKDLAAYYKGDYISTGNRNHVIRDY